MRRKKEKMKERRFSKNKISLLKKESHHAARIKQTSIYAYHIVTHQLDKDTSKRFYFFDVGQNFYDKFDLKTSGMQARILYLSVAFCIFHLLP
jgi:hypothetical protein